MENRTRYQLFTAATALLSACSGVGSMGEDNGGLVPPSCQSSGAGVTDCGPDHESCCTSLEVNGGAYFRTYTNDGTGPTNTADSATISDFRLDKYLVTVGRYRKFVTAWKGGSGYAPPVGSGKHTHLNGGKGLADGATPGSFETGWLAADNTNLAPTNDNLACSPDYATWTNDPSTHEGLPINCVNWWEAYAFCIWDGGFLPSEAEYQYAAAGGDEQRKFPWGSAAPGTASQYAIYGCDYADGSGTCSGIGNIAPVGTPIRGAGRWGQLDLVGELAEWNLDWYAPYVNPCVNCANLTSASGKVIRDGYFVSSDAVLLSSYRSSFYPTNRFYNFGFRCARPL
jgi:formylglycine-generating enzyme